MKRVELFGNMNVTVSPLTFYWISRLDEIRFIFTLLLVVSILLFSVLGAIWVMAKANEDDIEEKSFINSIKKAWYIVLTIIILALSGLVFLPDTSDSFRMLGTNRYDVRVETIKK